MVLKRHIKITDDVYEKLLKLKSELGLESPNQVIRKLIEMYESKKLSQHPIDTIVTCKARFQGFGYVLECSDGRKAFVSESALKKLVDVFGENIEII